jgi:serine/threonine protein kinase
MAAHGQSNTTNLVGVHYRVGKKIGEGSFGVIFEGIWTALLLPCSVDSQFFPFCFSLS